MRDTYQDIKRVVIQTDNPGSYMALLLKALELSLASNVGRMRTNNMYIEREDDPDYWLELAAKEFDDI